jgi:hypothetical protein
MQTSRAGGVVHTGSREPMAILSLTDAIVSRLGHHGQAVEAGRVSVFGCAQSWASALSSSPAACARLSFGLPRRV